MRFHFYPTYRDNHEPDEHVQRPKQPRLWSALNHVRGTGGVFPGGADGLFGAALQRGGGQRRAMVRHDASPRRVRQRRSGAHPNSYSFRRRCQRRQRRERDADAFGRQKGHHRQRRRTEESRRRFPRTRSGWLVTTSLLTFNLHCVFLSAHLVNDNSRLISVEFCLISVEFCWISSETCLISSQPCLISSQSCLISPESCLISSESCLISPVWQLKV